MKTAFKQVGNRLVNENGRKNTNSLWKRSLRRPQPVSANSAFPMFTGMVQTEGGGVAAGLVEEDADEEEHICASATSAACTLGSSKQKEGGLAF